MPMLLHMFFFLSLHKLFFIIITYLIIFSSSSGYTPESVLMPEIPPSTWDAFFAMSPPREGQNVIGGNLPQSPAPILDSDTLPGNYDEYIFNLYSDILESIFFFHKSSSALLYSQKSVNCCC